MHQEEVQQQGYPVQEAQVLVLQPAFREDLRVEVPVQVQEGVQQSDPQPVLLIIPARCMIHEPVNKLKDAVLSIVQAAAQAQHVQVIQPTTEVPLLLLHVAAGTLTNVLRQAPVEVAVIRGHTTYLREIARPQEVPHQVLLTLLQAEVLPVLLQAAEVHLREVPDRQAVDLRVAEAVVAAADKYKQYNHQR